jgi:hypothetical protein
LTAPVVLRPRTADRVAPAASPSDPAPTDLYVPSDAPPRDGYGLVVFIAILELDAQLAAAK